jgi:ankyrin repeat protein
MNSVGDKNIFDYCRDNNIKEVEKQLKCHSLEQIYALGSSGWSPLHLVSLQGNLNLVKLLIEHGLDVNRQDVEGCTLYFTHICEVIWKL